MDEAQIVLAIQDLLDGTIWEMSTLSEIAKLLAANGYIIRDKNGISRTEEDL